MRFFPWCAAAAWFGWLAPLSCRAGEIIILEPAPQGSRSEQGAERAKEKARQRAGKVKSGETAILLDAPAENRVSEQAEQLGREAREYLSPPSADGSTTVILRAAPPGEAEKARMKARAYVAPAPAKTKECASVTNQVGMIGEGAGAERSANVVEKGSSTVNLQAQCR